MKLSVFQRGLMGALLAVGFLLWPNHSVIAGPLTANGGLNIITREQWGADESLRYWTPELLEKYKWKNGGSDEKDSGGDTSDPCGDFIAKYPDEVRVSKVVDRSPGGDQLIWPLQYTDKIRKIVIHHTDSDIRDLNGDSFINSRDYKEFVRAIYHFHAVSRGWGDIGYNYLIDPAGNIYEGRYGGDKVIGGHVLCYNNGALGIAILGDYQNNDIPEPALQSLTALIAIKARQYNLDPEGTSSFRGKILPNVVGHRDLRPTACPGQKLYALLPKIRERANVFTRSGSFGEDFSTSLLDFNADPAASISSITLLPNERKTITLSFRNTGLKTWDQNTWLYVEQNNNPNARIVPLLEDKIFVAANLKESDVPPGTVGTFDVEIEAGYKGGSYALSVAPVLNGRYRVSRAMVDIPFTIEAPRFDYEVVASGLPSGIIFQSQKIEAWMELKNIGNITWRSYGSHPIVLGTESPRDRKSLFASENPRRLGYLVNDEVKPGEIGRFAIVLNVPTTIEKRVVERFTPVIEGIDWLPDKNLGFSATVKKPVHLAQMKRLNAPAQLLPGEMKKIEIQMINKGDLAWDPGNMSISILGRGLKVFKTRVTPDAPVPPKGNMTFNFWVQAPYEAGQYSLFLRSQFNRVGIRGGSTRMLVSVPEPRLRSQLFDQGDREVKLRPGEIKELSVKIKNLGNTVWYKDGPYALHLAPSQPQDRQSAVYYEKGWINRFRAGKLVEDQVGPGETGTFTFKVQSLKAGTYHEYFQPVIEQVGWLKDNLVRWDFIVAGERIEGQTEDALSDARQNARQAAVITKAIQTPVSSPKIYYTPPKIEERPFRIKLSYSSDESILLANGAYKIIGDQQEVLFDMPSGDPISVRRMGNAFHVQYRNVVRSSSILRFVPQNDKVMMEIQGWENRPSWNTQLNDNQFRGVIEIQLVNDAVTFINELPIEYYLRGLAEISNDSALEKQKAIAVLARTYARFYMQEDNRKFPGLPYDGSDDPDIFQRYLGYGMEKRSPNWVGAVKLTENEVVTYQGKLVKTPYFNQSDGRTRSAKEVWGWTNTPYLQSVSDPWCKGLELKGHGVGLSGCGAEAQAEEGKTYDDIIKYYYQGVEVEELKFQ
ncbi:MAG: N-acetylmuramoyl-L-alanine amidase [Candidatus Peregrinibacteria bacterium]